MTTEFMQHGLCLSLRTTSYPSISGRPISIRIYSGVARPLEHGERVVDRGDRVAELVAEHRQEFVLAAVVGAKLLVKPALLDAPAAICAARR